MSFYPCVARTHGLFLKIKKNKTKKILILEVKKIKKIFMLFYPCVARAHGLVWKMKKKIFF